GPGGMGKSTLVAQFVLQQADLGPDRRFPFAYLSFDRPDLLPHQPLTLLAESVRQFGAIYPWAAGEALELESAARATLVARSNVSSERLRSARQTAAIAQSGPDEADILDRFSELADRFLGRSDPLLWVLDAFEQAQRYGEPAVSELWSFLEQCQ